MMNIVFELSMHNRDLAMQEVLALALGNRHDLFKNLLVVEASPDIVGRLAYTKQAY